MIYRASLAALLFLSATTPQTTQDTGLQNDPGLLGKSRDAVIAQYGLPHKNSAGVGNSMWTYLDAAGAEHKFSFANDVAISTPGAAFKPARIQRVPQGRVYPGQPLAEAVKILGNAVSCSQGSLGIQARYPDGSGILFMNGRAYPGH